MKGYERFTQKDKDICKDCVLACFKRETCVKKNSYERLKFLENAIERGEIDYVADKDAEIARLTAENERLRTEKTCKNISENNPVDEFKCSKCGFMAEDFHRLVIDEDDGEHINYEYEIKYCPNCGAKVEDEQ